VRTTRELGHGLHEAEQALELARRLNVADRPLAFEHLGVYRILLDGGGSQHRHDFVEDALGPLGRYDVEHGTALVTTLRAYVEADYNAKETARRLYVHPNTLAYRLRAIRRLLGGDPARGDLRLTVELALKLKDLPRLSTVGDTKPSNGLLFPTSSPGPPGPGRASAAVRGRGPDRHVSRLERVVHRAQEFALDGIEIHGLAQP
jgi:hypothetical protein